MQFAVGTTEMTMLAWSLVLLIVQLLLQTITGVLELGLGYAMSPRDEGRQPQGQLARRAARALDNLLETYVAFVALALALVVSGKAGGIGALGAMVWFWARVVYVPIYLAGIPVARTLVWFVSVIGLVMMLLRLFS